MHLWAFMMAVVKQQTKSGRFVPLVKALAFCLVLCVPLSGCITSSPEDDYVAAVLAEAMKDYGALGEIPPVEPSRPQERTVSSVPAPAVSIPAQTAVSMSPGGTVSLVPYGGEVPVVAPAVVPPVESVTVPVGPAVSGAAAGTVSVVAPPAGIPAKPAAQPVVTAPENIAPVAPAAPGITGEPAALNGSPSSGERVTAYTPSATEPSSGVRPVMPKPAIATIQPDSILWISVTEDPSLSGRYLVNDASAIDFGYVGLVFLPDLNVEQAEAELKRVLEGRYLKLATVSVKLAKASYDRVSIQGNVEMPGDIKIGPGATITLNEALRRAGGLRGSRENIRVKIIRGGMKTPFGAAAEGDIYPLLSQNSQMKVPEVFLRNDDLAYVFTPSSEAVKGQEGIVPGVGGKRVILLGEVPRRGVVEFSENEPCTLMYLLFKIGGLPRFARGDKISVVRRDKDGREKKFMVNGEKLLKTGKPEDDIVLETGDRIVVPARSISFL